MKIITKIEQLIPGMRVSVYDYLGITRLHDMCLDGVYNGKVMIYGCKPINFENYVFELVSYPERRVLTWEYAKSKVDEWPLTVWDGDLQDQLLFANSNDFNCSYFYYKWPKDNFFIDPPHPEVEDITPPWELMQDKQEPVLKRVCVCGAEKYKLEGDFLFCQHCFTSKETASPSEPDDKIKRLWWYSRKDRHGGMTDFPMTEKEFIEDVLNCGYADKYAPGPIVPDESEWKEVK